MRPDLLRPKIIEALQKAVQKKGINEVALELDLSRSALYNSLNPYGDRAVTQMGLEKAIAIMAFTGDRTPLALIARELGCSIIEQREPDEETVDAELLQDYQAMATMARAIKKKASHSEVHRLALDAHSEIEQTVKKYMDGE